MYRFLNDKCFAKIVLPVCTHSLSEQFVSEFSSNDNHKISKISCVKLWSRKALLEFMIISCLLARGSELAASWWEWQFFCIMEDHIFFFFPSSLMQAEKNEGNLIILLLTFHNILCVRFHGLIAKPFKNYKLCVAKHNKPRAVPKTEKLGFWNGNFSLHNKFL